MSSLQDWQNEQSNDGAKHKFGNLSIITNNVKTQAGAKYTIPGVMTKDQSGNLVLREFRGKTLTNDPNDRLHVIAILEAADKNGVVYQDIRDDLSFNATIRKFKDSLVDTFGPSFADVFATRGKVPVEVELIPTGEKTNTDKDKTTFKVLRQFATDADRLAAEKEYFKKFGGSQANGNGSGIPADIEAKAAGLWQAVSQNMATFTTIVKGDSLLSPYADLLTAKFQTA